MDWWTAVAAAVGAAGGAFLKEGVSAFVRLSQDAERARDADVSEITQTLQTLGTLADEYWTTSQDQLGSRDAVIAAHINAHLQHLNLLNASLFTGDPKRECDVLIVRYMDAIAGGDFGNVGRSAEPERLLGVHSSALRLQHRVTINRRNLPRKLFA